MTFEELVAKVGATRYRAACTWAWRTAAGTGRDGGSNPWPEDIADVPHELSDLWYDSETSLEDKLDLALRFYSEMPCYANLMHVWSFYIDMDAGLRRKLWAAFRAALDSDDDRLADPVGYCLWADFFESRDTASDAWRETTARKAAGWERRVGRVIDLSGPVAWAEKGGLFEELAGDKSWHPHLLRALIGSQFDYFGDIDIEAARRLLARLSVSDNVPGLKEPQAKLGS